MSLNFNEVLKTNYPVSQYKLPLILIAVVVLTRIMFLDLPKVNLEFAFIDAVNYFITDKKEYINTYFQYQANTLGTSYLVYIISKLFSGVDVLILGRLLSVIGLILTGISVCLVSRKLGYKEYIISALLILVLFNPILWVYSGRFTADVFPLSLGLLGLAILYKYNSNITYYISSVFIGVSIVFKYHSVLFLVVAMLYIFLKKKIKSKFVFLCFFIINICFNLFDCCF